MTDLDSVPERTWILTGSPENYEATRELGFTLIGMKERRRRMTESMLPGAGSCSTTGGASRPSRSSCSSCAPSRSATREC
jgi:hypothetical protein